MQAEWRGSAPAPRSGLEPPVYIEGHLKTSSSENRNTLGLSRKNLTLFSVINSGSGDYGCLPKE